MFCIDFKMFCNFSSIIRKSQGFQKHKDFDVINLEEIKRDRKKFFVINLVKLHQQLFSDDAGFLFLGYLMRRCYRINCLQCVRLTNNMSDIFMGHIDYLSLPLPDAIACIRYSSLTSFDGGDLRLIQERRLNMQILMTVTR